LKSICLIDDDSIYRMLVKRLISFGGLSHDVLEFSDGQEAYYKLRELYQLGDSLPDVILLDINMPIWDGWDFLDEFIKLGIEKFPEVYVVTSSTNHEEKEKARSYAIVKECIVKPFDMEMLNRILAF
jgi:CheY-like chemotaxis protein